MLLNHMVDILKQRYYDKYKEHKVSNTFPIRSPTRKHLNYFMHMGYQRVLEGNIMADVGDGLNFKHTDRASERVKAHSCFVNDPERLNHMNQRTRLVLSIGMVYEIHKL